MSATETKIAAATVQAEAALRAGDLEGVTRALQARREALESGEQPTLEAYRAGERLMRGLLDLQRHAAVDNARLGQIQRYVDFRK